jgi:hypothetical protein
MDEEQRLIDKLHRIEALFARAGTPGEKAAAASAAERIRAQLAQVAKKEREVEMRFSVSDDWSRRLFLALLRRYGIRPYRYPRQRRTTVMARMPQSFADSTLWPEYIELAATLRRHLDDVTDRVIARAISPDTADEELRTQR